MRKQTCRGRYCLSGVRETVRKYGQMEEVTRLALAGRINDIFYTMYVHCIAFWRVLSISSPPPARKGIHKAAQGALTPRTATEGR